MVEAPPIHDEPYEVYLDHDLDEFLVRIVVRRPEPDGSGYLYMVAPEAWVLSEEPEALCSVPCAIWAQVEVLHKVDILADLATHVASVFAAARDSLSG